MELTWKLLLFVSIAIFLVKIATAADDEPTDDDWKEYKKKFNKTHSGNEDVKRRKNFAAKDKLIKQHNSAADKGNKTYHMGHNHFSDMTEDEIISQYTGYKPSNMTPPAKSRELANRQLPPYVDWRGHYCIGAVRDQKSCSACYAFAATAALEWAVCMNKGYFKALSEQHLIDCSGQRGCTDGRYEGTWDYAMRRPGQASLAVYPYTGTVGSCRSVYIDPTDRPRTWYYIPDEVSMAYEIANYGVVTVGFHAVSSFFSYKSGIYSDSTCSRNCGTANHAFVIVGYATSSTFPNYDFWIVRNSWTISWGVSGYGFIIRGYNMCNIACWAARVL